MTKKRRMFDIDLPDDDVPAPETKSLGGLRRGPMATAIGENADSLRQRAEQENAIRAENDALAHEFVRLKKLGLVTDLIALEAIHSAKLVRDRSARLDPELEELKASIKAIGLSNPIQVEQVGEGRYELVQGWRRLSAYRALLEETGDAVYATIPAGLLAKGETLDGLYRRMVDENMVRKDISWAEMARLAQAYATDPAIDCADLDAAVNLLFATAAPQKRSYIRRFASLLRMLDKALLHPEAISRALGLDLAHRLENDPALIDAVVAALRAVPNRSVAEELAVLRRFAEAAPVISPQGKTGRGRPALRGKTSLRLPLTVGEVRCTAAQGKVELRLDRDFSTVDRARLEAAVEAFFKALG
jgi:ParB family chromosome partitioning protein